MFASQEFEKKGVAGSNYWSLAYAKLGLERPRKQYGMGYMKVTASIWGWIKFQNAGRCVMIFLG